MSFSSTSFQQWKQRVRKVKDKRSLRLLFETQDRKETTTGLDTVCRKRLPGKRSCYTSRCASVYLSCHLCCSRRNSFILCSTWARKGVCLLISGPCLLYFMSSEDQKTAGMWWRRRYLCLIVLQFGDSMSPSDDLYWNQDSVCPETTNCLAVLSARHRVCSFNCILDHNSYLPTLDSSPSKSTTHCSPTWFCYWITCLNHSWTRLGCWTHNKTSSEECCIKHWRSNSWHSNSLIIVIKSFYRHFLRIQASDSSSFLSTVSSFYPKK